MTFRLQTQNNQDFQIIEIFNKQFVSEIGISFFKDRFI